jgi:hypothetical protein
VLSQGCAAFGGIHLRKLFAAYIRKIPIELRTYLLAVIYGLFGGLAAVAFQKGASVIFAIFLGKAVRANASGNLRVL